MRVSGAFPLRQVITGASIGNAVEWYDSAAAFFSIGYNVCVAAFGGTTPYLVAWLTGSTGNNLAPAFYVIVAVVVSFVAALTLRESAGRPLPAAAPTEVAIR